MKKEIILLITRTAMLAAIMVLMDITGIGYIKTAGLEFTLMMIPMIIGAILMGPAAGAVLGGVFGMTSFLQCLGKSTFGAALFAINPFYTFIVCVVTRIIAGCLCGVVFNGVLKCMHGNKKNMIPYAAAGISGAVLNTILFMGALMILFGRTEYIRGFMGNMNVMHFIIVFIGIQGLVEAVVSFICATVITRALYPVVRGK